MEPTHTRARSVLHDDLLQLLSNSDGSEAEQLLVSNPELATRLDALDSVFGRLLKGGEVANLEPRVERDLLLVDPLAHCISKTGSEALIQRFCNLLDFSSRAEVCDGDVECIVLTLPWTSSTLVDLVRSTELLRCSFESSKAVQMLMDHPSMSLAAAVALYQRRWSSDTTALYRSRRSSAAAVNHPERPSGLEQLCATYPEVGLLMSVDQRLGRTSRLTERHQWVIDAVSGILVPLGAGAALSVLLADNSPQEEEAFLRLVRTACFL